MEWKKCSIIYRIGVKMGTVLETDTCGSSLDTK